MTGKRTDALDALREALAIAVCSPSSHNSQAWSLRITGSGADLALELGVDHDRKLHALPAHRIEMLLGLGTYWHALAVALASRGWSLERDDRHASSHQEPALRGRMIPATPDPTATGEIALITGRRTNRGPYAGTPIEPATHDDIIRDARTRPAWAAPPDPPTDVRIVSDAVKLAELARITREVAPRDFLHRRAWRETADHLHRDAVASSARTGFSYSQIFGQWPWPLDHLIVALTSPVLMPATGRLGLARSLSRRLAAAIGAGPGVLVMTAPSTMQSPTDWAWAGTDLHRAWLTASRHGLSLHPVSILLQHHDSRNRLERLLDLPGRAFFLARIGHGLPGRKTGPVVRRSPDAVLVQDQ